MGHFFKGIAVDKEDFERIRQEAERAGIAFYTNNNNSLFFILESQNNKQPECLTSRGYRGWVKIIKFGEVSSCDEALHLGGSVDITFGRFQRYIQARYPEKRPVEH